jgi:ATP-binding cassette subfamily G (WHITE) protein 2 (PDR)
MMSQEFRGQCTYTSEVDTHFPELTVWETIKFAVSSRLPQTVSKDITRREHIEHITRAVLRLFNLTSAKDTKVGNELIRGVSGGERRRVTIAESFVSFSPVQFWDNNTRGMDSATALRCVQNIEMFTRFSRGTATMSIYQASQSILDLFGKVIVLFEGRQIFFGTWSESSDYFEALGFRRPRRCTTGDFLTALTNPIEARDLVIPGWTSNVPVTSHEFAEAWRDSEQRRKVSKSIALLLAQWKSNNNHSLASLRAARRAERSGRLYVSLTRE